MLKKRLLNRLTSFLHDACLTLFYYARLFITCNECATIKRIVFIVLATSQLVRYTWNLRKMFCWPHNNWLRNLLLNRWKNSNRRRGVGFFQKQSILVARTTFDRNTYFFQLQTWYHERKSFTPYIATGFSKLLLTLWNQFYYRSTTLILASNQYKSTTLIPTPQTTTENVTPSNPSSKTKKRKTRN